MITGLCSAVYCVLLPIILILNKRDDNEKNKDNNSIFTSCMFPLVFTIIFAPMSMMSNLSRYLKIFLLNIRDIGRMKLFNENNGSVFPGGREGSVNSDFEPNTYVKRLNKLVSKQITIICFIVPYALLIVLGVSIIIAKNNVCENTIDLYTPIMILSLFTTFIIPYIFIRLYKTLNFVNKVDIVANFLGLTIGSLLFVSSLFVVYTKKVDRNLSPEVKRSYVKYFLFADFKCNELFFLIPSFVSFASANIIPLIEVFISDRKIKQKKLLSKKEFTRLLMGSRYIESLKSVAVKSYCVELVIFWETHMKLLKRVYDEYVKIQGEKREINKSDEEKRDERTLVEKRNNSLTKMQCNNISSPIPSNYELLLGLNKNIFGRDNDKILYTGCYSGTGINPNLINYAMMESNRINEEKSHTIDIYSTSPSDMTMMNRNRAFSLDDAHQRDRSDSVTSPTVISNSSYPISSNSYGRGNNYNYNHNNNNNNNSSGRGNNNYNGRPRDESTFSQSSYTSLTPLPYSNYDSLNSDKAGLLHHTDTQEYKGMNSGMKNSYSNNSANVANRSFSSRFKKNPNYNSNTEIFYELFDLDPEHVVLPSQFWKEYNKLYHSFISDKSLATVNLDDSTIIKLNRAINFKNYTIDMFFPAISETVDLIYQNLYPKLVVK